ncbi:hypothetical protein BHE74_00057965 [Ensete ventricosum]|nr:hypothetical protein BHE74_00057965 [Ensete ventricosum]
MLYRSQSNCCCRRPPYPHSSVTAADTPAASSQRPSLSFPIFPTQAAATSTASPHHCSTRAQPPSFPPAPAAGQRRLNRYLPCSQPQPPLGAPHADATASSLSRCRSPRADCRCPHLPPSLPRRTPLPQLSSDPRCLVFFPLPQSPLSQQPPAPAILNRRLLSSSSCAHRRRCRRPPLHHRRPFLPSPTAAAATHCRNLLLTAACSPRSHTPTRSPPPPCFSPSSLLLTYRRCLPLFLAATASPLPPLLCCCRPLLLPRRRTVAPPPLPAVAAHPCLCRCCRRPHLPPTAPPRWRAPMLQPHSHSHPCINRSRALLIVFPLPPLLQPCLTVASSRSQQLLLVVSISTIVGPPCHHLLKLMLLTRQ